MHRELDARNLDLAGIIRPGDHIVWAHGAGEPQTLVERLPEQRHRIGPASVFLGNLDLYIGAEAGSRRRAYLYKFWRARRFA